MSTSTQSFYTNGRPVPVTHPVTHNPTMIEIKRLRQGDEVLAQEIVDKFWPEGRLNETFLSKQTNYLLAAYVDDAFAGFLYAFELDRLEQERPMMFFYSIDVLEKYRRQGIGKRLIEELNRICAQRNVSKMYVLTDEANTAALKLYQSTGGKRVMPDNVLFVYKEFADEG
ncbi:GNAT family N-acetyltransferase [candidate division WOR-3 bacterium]|uniref:GNAT family N-acetyltransferase n=1 Tax=candidate division WOR-3 bacterium TaxID=2052148 RepID=A0A9D5QCR1_UNCW3|nr:GNAT family N-acetyltransferase [candidate division WOR-3 bacterium]MBD3364317.1 GNAT family N-acetyltransferase [candidate division WOR-3 bacterium]